MKANDQLPTNNYITNKDLTSALDKQSKDLKQLISQQSKDFTQLANNIMIEIGIKFSEIDSKFGEIDNKFLKSDKKLDKLNFNILDSNLQIIEELKTSRQEQILINHKLFNHEDRITHLEKSVQTAS
jgi:hypothetical protein